MNFDILLNRTILTWTPERGMYLVTAGKLLSNKSILISILLKLGCNLNINNSWIDTKNTSNRDQKVKYNITTLLLLWFKTITGAWSCTYGNIWYILRKGLKWPADFTMRKFWALPPSSESRMAACAFGLSFDEELFKRLIWSDQDRLVLLFCPNKQTSNEFLCSIQTSEWSKAAAWTGWPPILITRMAPHKWRTLWAHTHLILTPKWFIRNQMSNHKTNFYSILGFTILINVSQNRSHCARYVNDSP